jgi:hypothetical protein
VLDDEPTFFELTNGFGRVSEYVSFFFFFFLFLDFFAEPESEGLSERMRFFFRDDDFDFDFGFAEVARAFDISDVGSDVTGGASSKSVGEPPSETGGGVVFPETLISGPISLLEAITGSELEVCDEVVRTSGVVCGAEFEG